VLKSEWEGSILLGSHPVAINWMGMRTLNTLWRPVVFSI